MVVRETFGRGDGGVMRPAPSGGSAPREPRRRIRKNSDRAGYPNPGILANSATRCAVVLEVQFAADE